MIVKHKGVIVNGYGFATSIMKDKLKEYHQKLDANIIPGTINLKLDKEFNMPQECIVIDWGTQKFYYYQISLFGKTAYVMRPERNPFSKDIVEIIATEHICSKYSLNYGDKVEFSINI